LKYDKPHKWNNHKDTARCIHCDVDFQAGDMVYTDVAVNVHVGCVKEYVENLKREGLRKILEEEDDGA
jgi:hypothetical protein